jgi:hypothetical protein
MPLLRRRNWDRWNVPLKNLPEDNHCLADKAAQFFALDGIKMFFGIHEIDEQIDAALMQYHSNLLCSPPL